MEPATNNLPWSHRCCSPPDVLVVRGEIGYLFFVFSLLTFFLTTFSIYDLQLLLSFAVVPQSPPTLSRSLLTQSAHRILGFPRLFFFRSLSGNVISLPIFHLLFCPHDRPISTYTSHQCHLVCVDVILDSNLVRLDVILITKK